MKEWPLLNDTGDLPPGIHPATLAEVLERIYSFVHRTGGVARFIIFGSFMCSRIGVGGTAGPLEMAQTQRLA